MKAIEISKCEKGMRSKPVFLQGIMQPTLHELVSECDVIIRGINLRLPAGVVVCLIGGGSGGNVGSLWCDVEFTAANGETYRAERGMDLRIPITH